MTVGRRFFMTSLVGRLGIALGAFVLLALGATISATVFTELTTGKAAAINVAGSLRMQSYWITVQVLRVSADGRPLSELRKATAEFERRLTSPPILDGIPREADSPTRRAYDRVYSQWFDAVKPGLLRAASADASGRDAFVSRMAAYVGSVDQLVYLLERDLEGRIQNLEAVQGAALFATTIVVLVALYLLHTQVIIPMADLLRCARRVRAGDFTARTRHVGDDELGQLGQAFNFMVSDLSRNYASLEARVEEKAEQLARSNASLEVLYNTTRRLAAQSLTRETLTDIMGDIERAIGVEVSVVCVRDDNDRQGYPIIQKPGSKGSPRVAAKHCAECLGNGQAGLRTVGSGESRMLAVPLTEGGKLYGVMLVRKPAAVEPADWKLQLLESIGHHIGAALAAAKRSEVKGRIALIEERSVIARELHDSLAQSLSYLNIQVARLKAYLVQAAGDTTQTAVSAPAPISEQIDAVVEELKLGLRNAYRQLRELLTTFRLGMQSGGLLEALQDAIGEFSRRTDTEFRLHNQLLGHELDSSEQIHVLQVVREALTNVEHHARARHADVRVAIEGRRVRVTVDDDGVGIPCGSPPDHHYGLAIMHARATSLGGHMRISPRPEGGTRVELEFMARGPWQVGSEGPRAVHGDARGHANAT